MSYRLLVPALHATCSPQPQSEKPNRAIKDIASMLAPTVEAAPADDGAETEETNDRSGANDAPEDDP